jgi:hypothetical protein
MPWETLLMDLDPSKQPKEKELKSRLLALFPESL